MSALRPRPPRTGLMVGILVFAAVATTAYWGVWFFVDRDLLATSHAEAYYKFENAFPLADGWMVAVSVLAAVALWRRRSIAFLWVVSAGSSAVYLAAMDFLFDVENGIYRAPTGDRVGVVIEGVIILLTLAGGVYAMGFAWRSRAYFHAQEP